jgi:hypothetical protein
MITFILVIIGLAIVLSLLSTILQGIGGMQDRNYTERTFNELIQENNISNYEYERLSDGTYLINNRGGNSLYFIHKDGWVSRGYSRVTKVELSIDDSVAYQASLGSMAGRAIVGGVLAGGVGAIIGGVTGKKNSKKIANRITLTISFSTPDIPYVSVSFLNNQQGVDIFSDEYNNAEKRGLYWSNLISALMKTY